MEKSNIQQKIHFKALQYLARRQHSREELRKKLQQKFPRFPKQIEAVLTECVRYKWLDDKQYAAEFIRYRLEMSPRGKFALRTELAKKGIPADIIRDALETISDESEFAAAQKAALQKVRTFSEDTSESKRKEKLIRFLSARGFSHDMILKVLSESEEGSQEWS